MLEERIQTMNGPVISYRIGDVRPEAQHAVDDQALDAIDGDEADGSPARING